MKLLPEHGWTGCFSSRMIVQLYRYFFVKFIFFINAIFKNRNIPPEKFKNVLIIHNQLIGDAICSTPFIRNFKDKFPEVNIFMMVSSEGYEALKKCPHVDKFVVFDERFNNFFDFIKKYRVIITRVKELKIDLIIDFQMTFLYFTRVLLPLLSGAKHRISFKRGGFRSFLPTHEITLPEAHVVLQYLSVLDAFNIKCGREKKLEVYFDEEDNMWADDFFKKNNILSSDFIVAIHPGNKNYLKRWDSDYFAKLIDILIKEYNFKVIIVGSSEDEDVIREILARANSNPSLAYGKTTLTQHCALLSKVNLLISIDTCSVHMASALDLPTVVMYGPTDIVYWGAWNKEKQEIISKGISCKPCEDNNPDLIVNKIRCTQKENICMKEIKVDDVLSAARRFFPKQRYIQAGRNE